MKVELTLTELFVLGHIMNGQYIDVDYIPTEDITINYAGKKSVAIAHLSELGVIKETFTKTTVSRDYKDLLIPVFNATTTCSVEHINIENKYLDKAKYHFSGRFVTKTKLINEKLTIETATMADVGEQIRMWLGGLFFSDIPFSDGDIESIKEAVIVRRSRFGKDKNAINIYKNDNGLFVSENDMAPISMSSDQAYELAMKVLREDYNGCI